MTAEEAITELRGKIDRIGPVNMMAIEQHTELEARHGFLTTQRQDLIDSIAQTNEAIKRIDETTHARFREAFTAINANFQQTFATLFGGGRAGISLLDESDPLESGIDIVASPPGKRLQSVMLLSGGEKALTAIALMFAIFRYKPSPFCLLDEIDAPLDDANIGRFVELLRGMMDKTQFIIITHSRKTMEIAQPAVRRDDGGAGRFEAHLHPDELNRADPGANPSLGTRIGSISRHGSQTGSRRRLGARCPCGHRRLRRAGGTGRRPVVRCRVGAGSGHLDAQLHPGQRRPPRAHQRQRPHHRGAVLRAPRSS